MEKKFFFILFLSAFLFIYNPGFASSKINEADHNEYSPESISSFIKHLINNGEYYRAHTELGRLVSFYPEYISPLCYNITESYIFYKSRRYDDIPVKGDMFSGDDSLCAVNLFRIDSMMRSGDFKDKQLLEELIRYQCPVYDYSDYYKKRRLYYSIISSFNDDLYSDSAFDMEYRDSMDYAKSLSRERKSPAFGALFGIIPGMGYVYAGEAGTGIVALIVIAAGSAITWGAHANDIEPLAVVSGTATFFMYTGSIAGGYMQTLRYNRGLSEKLVLRLDKDFMLDRDIDAVYIKCGIESNVR